MKPAGSGSPERNNMGGQIGFSGQCGQCGVRSMRQPYARPSSTARLAASAELEEPRGQVWELPDGRLYQHGGNRPFLLAVSSRVRIPLK
jgi:hypothetical protein